MKKRTWKEYRPYIFSKSRQDYIVCGTMKTHTLEECKEYFYEKKKQDEGIMYKDCDWNNVKFRCQEYVCTDWGFVDEDVL